MPVLIALSFLATRYFQSTAERLGGNRRNWVFVGGMSFFLPALLFGVYIFPFLHNNELHPTRNEMLLASVLESVTVPAVGALFCFCAYRILVANARKNTNTTS